MWSKHFGTGAQCLSEGQLIDANNMRGVRRAIRLKRLDRLEIHLTRLRQMGEVLVQVDLLPASPDPLQREFGLHVETDHDVWQPNGVQSKQPIEFVDELAF